MNTVVIGVHGLANKPPKEILKNNWKKAINEGLSRNYGCELNKDVDFRMVYWADAMYDKPKLHDDYKPAQFTRPYNNSAKEFITDLIGDLGDTIVDAPLTFAKRYFGFDAIAERVLERKLRDLHKYYTYPDIRDNLRGRLKEALKGCENKRVMIISHSMGTIIAYDTLREIGRQVNNKLTVNHLVTIGSPLGMPHVKYKIWEESPLLRTPSNTYKWTNFSDRRDPVAIDTHLSNDYEPNGCGIQVTDKLIYNDFGGIRHKSYGYLRCPEVSQVIKNFI